MSKLQVEQKGQGASSFGFEKIWEGDVHLTGTKEDVTDGAVDLTDYNVLLIRYRGTLTCTSSTNSASIAIGSVNTGSNTCVDAGVSKKGTTQVDFTMFLVRINATSWRPMRYVDAMGLSPVSNPLKLAHTGGAIIADFHFTYCGMKL